MQGLTLTQQQRLAKLALDNGVTMATLLSQVVEAGLEDVEDYYQAAKIMAQVDQGKEALHSLEDVERELGLK